MTQEKAWEKEYQHARLITLSDEPHADVRKFWRYVKKKEDIDVAGLRILDLGSGTGKHAFYFAERGAEVTGLEIANTALRIARERMKEKNLNTLFIKSDIGGKLPFTDGSYSIILDIMTSNSLSSRERATYLAEAYRVLKKSGWLLVKILCKDGDPHAKTLLKQYPGNENDTYILPDLGLQEHVYARTDFEKDYGRYFDIVFLEKKSGYTLCNNIRYKRNFLVAYCKKVS